MSNTVTYDEPAANAGAAAADKARRPFIALAALFVIAFAVATGAQIKAHLDNAASTTTAAQASAAGLIAERVNANLALAVGAAGGAADLARSSGADAPSMANAAASSAPATTGAVVARNGVIELRPLGNLEERTETFNDMHAAFNQLDLSSHLSRTRQILVKEFETLLAILGGQSVPERKP